MARSSSDKPIKNFFTNRVNIGIMVVFIIVAIVGGVFANRTVFNVVNGMSMLSVPGAPPVQDNTPTPLPPGTTQTGPTPTAPSYPQSDQPTAVAWDGVSRINMLIMGLDYRDWQAHETPRSDTMIVLTLDPVNKTAGMLSIPRDMWVNIPGFDYMKINQAYFLGESEKLPGGGAGLAVKTVENFLGIPINYVAVVDFYTFVNFVDKIGGITIDIPQDVRIGILGKPSELIKAGPQQHLFGLEALGYARDRYTEGGDFDRAKRQQAVIIGIRNRVLKNSIWPGLLANAPQLYQEFSSGVHTNLTLDEVVKLALIARQIPPDQIKMGVISTDSVVMAKSLGDGLDILVPIPNKVQATVNDFFTSGVAFAPSQVNSDPAALMKAENAKISLQNASSQAGLATRTSDYFKSLGLNVTDITNTQLTTMATVTMYTSKPYTLAYLAKLMNLPESQIHIKITPNAPADFAVVLGASWAQKNPMPK